jgi:uracil-DNA glycosylase
MTDAPRSLRDDREAARRKALLAAPRMVPLAAFARDLRAQVPGTVVPDLDPLDGGVEAQLLFLLEKPGPGAARTGFVSIDNDDPTAETMWRAFRDAGIDRRRAIIWNTAPWWNGTIRFTAAERRHGLSRLPAFLDLLPRLEAVVLVGNQARHARDVVEGRGLRVHQSAHPSPQVRAAFPDRWRAIPAVWAEAAGGGPFENGRGHPP